MIFTLYISCGGKSRRGRDRDTAVSRIVDIVRTFLGFRKTAQSVKLSQSIEITGSSGENLMYVSLMSNVPDDLIFWAVEHLVKGYGKFDYS